MFESRALQTPADEITVRLMAETAVPFRDSDNREWPQFLFEEIAGG